MNIRTRFFLVLCLVMTAATPALHALTVRNGTSITVKAVLDDILAPAVVSQTLLPKQQWNPSTSPEARYQLTFLQGDQELASTVLHGGATAAELEATPAGYRIVVSGAGGKASSADDAAAIGCMSGEMIGLVFGCLTFNADNGKSYTIGGNTNGLPVLGPACICGTEAGKIGPCLEPGFIVESKCVTGPTGAVVEPEQPALIVRNLTPTPARVSISHPPSLVITSRDIPPQGSITLQGGRRLTSLVFFINDQPVASTVVRDVAVAALEKLPSRYVIAIVPNQSQIDAVAADPVGCFSGTAIGMLMDSRAFTSGDQTFYLSGNLDGVPMLGKTCVCGTVLPPNEKAPIPLPIIRVDELCED